MLDAKVFKNQIGNLSQNMQLNLRGELDEKVERNVIKELASIYESMAGKYVDQAAMGSTFDAQPGVAQHPVEQRPFYALLDLIERMECDFSAKFALDFKHGIEKDVAIGKIKIAFLDGVRRTLRASKVDA